MALALEMSALDLAERCWIRASARAVTYIYYIYIHIYTILFFPERRKGLGCSGICQRDVSVSMTIDQREHSVGE